MQHFCHCVHRPPPPCGLALTARACSWSAQCEAGEVCCYARCAASRPSAPVGKCFAAVVALLYRGAPPDRVYRYDLSVEPVGVKVPAASRLASKTATSVERTPSHGSYYDNGARATASAAELSLLGDTLLVVYYMRDGASEKLWAGWAAARSGGARARSARYSS